MPTYHLYVRNKADYEVVENGFSTLALWIGPWSGIATLRGMILILGPLLVTVFGVEAFHEPNEFVIGIGLIGMFCGGFYYVANANHWRVDDLESQGFSWVATIESESAKSALKKWALSKEATKFLDNDT